MKIFKVSGKVNSIGTVTMPVLNTSKFDGTSRVYRRLKVVAFLSGFAFFAIFFTSCMAGYVASEPTYVEVVRPQRPGTDYIWMDGGWAYNHQSHVYVQRSGYWQKPNQGRSYVPGHWQSSNNGKSWKNGYYQRNGQKGHNRKK